MPHDTIASRDPIAETYALILQRHAAAVYAAPVPPKDAVADAWRDVLGEILELRVGRSLSDGMTEDQISDFERVADTGDDGAAHAWLDEHAPDHRQIVADTIDGLIAEAAQWYTLSCRNPSHPGAAR